jgi:diguanylate cyclase (GGDEF)-like protein/PAS domain S-box-containing protein
VIDVVEELPPADRASAFANAPVGVALATPDAVLIEGNAALGALLGRSSADLRGTSLFDLCHPDDRSSAREACAAARLRADRSGRAECRLIRADGSTVPVQVTASLVEEEPGVAGAHLVMIIEDITERKQLEAQLVHRSLHDPLTGLPNRTLFRDRLLHALERGHREQTPTCVLIVDLDEFKAINDRHGHPSGDVVLVTVAERLTSVLRASDTAARLGGDEFAIVCENTELAEAEVLADRLRGTMHEPLSLGDVAVSLGISVGIGSVTEGADPEEVYARIVRAADDAMYADKARRAR